MVVNIDPNMTRELCLEDQSKMKEYVTRKFENLRDYVDEITGELRDESCVSLGKLESKIDRLTWFLVGGMVSIIGLLIEIAFHPIPI